MSIIKCVQVNLRKSFAAGIELSELSQRFTHGVLLLSETNFNRNGKLLWYSEKNIQIFKSQVNEVRTSVILKGIKGKFIEDLSNKDICTVSTFIDNKEIIFSSVYFDGTKKLQLDFIKKIILHCNKNNCAFICGGDLNLHSSALLGGPVEKDDARGYSFERFVAAENISVLNRPTVSNFTYSRDNCVSWIDGTFANDKGVDIVSNWEVLEDVYSGSDHKFISFELNTVLKISVSKIRNMNNVIWENFKESLWSKFAAHHVID